MANLPVISFNAGKLTPLVDVRSDTAKYSAGCRILDNMMPLIYGPVTRRPGTLYRANVEDDSKKSRIVSFIFSATIAYVIEFADQIMNVYFGGSTVDTGIVSPYLEADLPQLQFEQIADIMWITHSSYNPRKLSRTSATEFSLDEITFKNGPFLKRNDIANKDGVTMRALGLTIDTATAGTDKFTIESATDISSAFPANRRFYVSDSTGNNGAYTVHATTATTYVGTTVTITTNEDFTDSTGDGKILVEDGEVTLRASDDVFESGHVDTLFKLTHKRLVTVVSDNATGTGVIGQSIGVKGNWTVTLLGNWDATVEVQRLADGVNWETFRTFTSVITDGRGSRTVQKTELEEADGVQLRMNVTTYNSGTIEASLSVDESTQDSIYKITAVTSATEATATTIIPAPDGATTNRWFEGSWSNVRGWPSAVTFFEERAVYGFTNSDAQNIWLSEVGQAEDFEPGLNDSDAFTIVLQTANKGRWLGALETLSAGTTGEEWRIRSSEIDEPLTPTNWSIKEQTAFGSADIQAMSVNEAILFVDFVGRKIREYTWSEPNQKYVSPDLTALAEDITTGGITSMAVQKRPDSIIWLTISNSPYLISMTYEREQNVVAFANHPLGGDGIAESISITPSASEDVITLSVKRTINGSTVRFIEEMQPRDWGSTTSAANSFFVDAGIIDTGGTTTITGLDHLEGEEVSVLVDGAVQASKIVFSGQITIDEAGDRVVVGLPYTYQASPMRPDVQLRYAGTTHGSIQIVPEIVLSLFASGNVSYGDGVTSFPIDFRTTEPYGSPPALFTGDTDALVFDAGFNKDMDIVISGSDPLPCTLRAIILRAKQTGR